MRILIALLVAVSILSVRGVDRNGNGFSDVWEALYNLNPSSAEADADADGSSNGSEARSGTNPFDPLSIPRLSLEPSHRLTWSSLPGKRYTVQTSTNLLTGPWTTETQLLADSNSSTTDLQDIQGTRFFRLAIDDVDTDGDGVLDWEEYTLGFNPGTRNSERLPTSDFQRVTNGLSAPTIVTLAALDPVVSERWPDPGIVAVRRSGGLLPVTVTLMLDGAATLGVDYTANATTNITIPAGVREVWLEFRPIADTSDTETDESILVSLQPGSGYSLGTNTAAQLTLLNETAASPPAVKAAARFLIQAAFGPDQDLVADSEDLPENVREVTAAGFEGWIDEQFARPVGKLQPFVDWARPRANDLGLYGDLKQYAWWNRAMGVPSLYPGGPEQLPDPLRQRVAFALSQIFVISDRLEDLAVEPGGMANYYDMLLAHAFGNFGDLLHAVALHPCMGIYLSHAGNKKADPANHTFPDENFAREIMQLFSIGLWELNPDGTRKLDGQGQPIPTYTNGDITELARVFTGFSFGGPENNAFALYPRDWTNPMKCWDAYHDCGPKTLLGGLALPARSPSSGNNGSAGMEDLNAAVSNLFHHPNVGPFIGRQLIQKFVTSNPSPGYVARVALKFADNGSGVRGDMKAVIKAILLDPEARDPAMLQDPTFGKLREPFLRCVNFARAFDATSPSRIYALGAFTLDHVQEPLKAPSVFNFFLPNHSPPGPITQAGLVAPEFQIINASSSISSANYFWNAVWGGLHRWGAGDANYAVSLNLTQEMQLVVPAASSSQDVPNSVPFDPDRLIRRLDLTLTAGTLSPHQYQLIREALYRLPRPTWHWHKRWLQTAIYLVVTSPDFCVLR